MKIMKKLVVTLLAMMLVCPCFANTAYAAEGVAYFTDLETKVGDEFTITGTVVAKNDVIGDVSIELKYDTKYMQFISGDSGVEAIEGKVSFTGSGDGSSDRLTFDMTFQALEEGETQMDQTGADITTNSGATVNCTMGYSAITIGEGDPSKIKNLSEDENTEDTTDNTSSEKKGPLVIGGVEYKLSEDFSETEIPSGFTSADVTYDGKTYKGITHTVAGVNALYTINDEGLGKFFFVNDATGELYPMEEFIISEQYSIFILHANDEVKLSKEYAEAEISINEVDYPVWIAPDREGFYIFYAMNNMGEKSLYLYDSVEQTYQRMETPKTAKSENVEVSKLDKAIAIAEENVVWIVVGAGCALIVLLILVIVLSVKLSHRNSELDDLYDEYGIDMDEEQSPKNVKELDFREVESDEYADDDYAYDDGYDYSDDEYADDDYGYEDDQYADDQYEYADDEYGYDDEYEYDQNDYYEEDELAELRRDFAVEQNASLNVNYDDYYDDGDFDDDYDDYVEADVKHHLNKNDTFEMNFIDLD